MRDVANMDTNTDTDQHTSNHTQSTTEGTDSEDPVQDLTVFRIPVVRITPNRKRPATVTVKSPRTNPSNQVSSASGSDTEYVRDSDIKSVKHKACTKHNWVLSPRFIH